MLTWPIKSPGEVLDYAIDWNKPPNALAGESVETSTWIVPNGLTKVKDSHSGNICIVWLAGGKMNNRFTVINQVETASGRKLERYARLIIGAK